jgi:peptidoglycan/LPS O-acetylase OafA/YrhL
MITATFFCFVNLFPYAYLRRISLGAAGAWSLEVEVQFYLLAPFYA